MPTIKSGKPATMSDDEVMKASWAAANRAVRSLTDQGVGNANVAAQLLVLALADRLASIKCRGCARANLERVREVVEQTMDELPASPEHATH